MHTIVVASFYVKLIFCSVHSSETWSCWVNQCTFEYFVVDKDSGEIRAWSFNVSSTTPKPDIADPSTTDQSEGLKLIWMDRVTVRPTSVTDKPKWHHAGNVT